MTKLIITLLFIFAIDILSAQMPGSKIGLFDKFSDIGAPSTNGEVIYDHTKQQYAIKASGKNIWFGTDSFSYLSKEMSGDFIFQAKLKFVGAGNDPHKKTGLMLRSTLSPTSPMVACTVHGDGLLSLQFRKVDGTDVEEIKFEAYGAEFVQLEKKGNTFTMSVAQYGNPYAIKNVLDLDLGDTLNAGLYVCSHNDDFVEEAVFNNVRIFNTAPDDLIPYQQYLGSLLEVLDVQTGDRTVLASDQGSLQAPNWTPDGKTLIYNANGKLYNFDLKTRTVAELPTGFADKNNNDHVLTFDGTMIGISHHAKEVDGKSIIYTLPIAGGTPKKITEEGPSYLHGWSPDNNYLIYTAQRKGAYNIYRIPAAGGKEQKLTNTSTLDDGPEYSPDGKYIYFNSARTGTMQLWRMDANGKHQTQLTFDSLNDWFPHVSPDNKSIVFISFPEEVPAGDHPFYKRVTIRLMDIASGNVKTIGYVYGGQGTINVPSWSPDSKKIALVSNGNF